MNLPRFYSPCFCCCSRQRCKTAGGQGGRFQPLQALLLLLLLLLLHRLPALSKTT
jgi:hypothetical protein